MYEQVKKPKENKSRAIAHSVAQKKRKVKQKLGFVDNRSEALAQRTLQAMADNNPQIRQIAQLQAMAANYSVEQPNVIQKKEKNEGLTYKIKSDLKSSPIQMMGQDSQQGSEVGYALMSEESGQSRGYSGGSAIGNMNWWEKWATGQIGKSKALMTVVLLDIIYSNAIATANADHSGATNNTIYWLSLLRLLPELIFTTLKSYYTKEKWKRYGLLCTEVMVMVGSAIQSNAGTKMAGDEGGDHVYKLKQIGWALIGAAYGLKLLIYSGRGLWKRFIDWRDYQDEG